MNQPAREPRCHRLPVRVYFEDTDAGGMVYHANYLQFAERARTEFLRTVGFDHQVLREHHGVAIVVRSCWLECLVPARLDDLLDVRSRLRRLGGASLHFRQEVIRDADLVATLDVRVAFVDLIGRPTRIPGEMRSAFARWLDKGD